MRVASDSDGLDHFEECRERDPVNAHTDRFPVELEGLNRFGEPFQLQRTERSE